MDNYECYIARSRKVDKDGKIIFHLRLRWKSDIDLVPGITYWDLDPNKRVRVNKYENNTKFIVSFGVIETLEQNFLVKKDNIKITPKDNDVKNVNGKFKIHVQKLNGKKEVIEKDFPSAKIPIEYSSFLRI